MPLDDRYPLAVTFITKPRGSEGGATRFTPVGTGFILNMPSRVRGLRFEYIVTASHVVLGEEGTHARFRTKAGGVKDVPVHEWFHHPGGADVAMTPLGPDEEVHRLNIPVEVLAGLTPGGRGRANLGERVYFLGLLGAYDGLSERNVPMVRSGTVGALDEEDVPVNFRGSVSRIRAHLIDCRSYNGFSGSPCFFQREESATLGGVPTTTLLLGLVSGHFDAWEKTRLPKLGEPGERPAWETGSIEARGNSGVGVVTPAHDILEMLFMEELSEERQRIEEEESQREPEGATLDSSEPEEYQQFEDFARKLVKVPKQDLGEKRKGEG